MSPGTLSRTQWLLLAISLFWTSVLYGSTSFGSAAVLPDTATAGGYGSWRVIYTVGDTGIKTGGAIKIRFPNGWYNSPWPEGKIKSGQSDNPNRNHYLNIDISRKDCSAELSIIRAGVDGQHDRYGRAFLITIQKGSLAQGDRVTLHFSNTNAPITSETHRIAVGVDPDGGGEFKSISRYPALTILPGTPVQMRVIAQSQGATGRPVKVTVVALDPFDNATHLYRGTVTLSSDDSAAELPGPYHFSVADTGRKTFSVVFSKPGIQIVKASDDQYLAPHGLESNPINVGGAFADENIFWGDLHSHSTQSKDGAGLAETAYRYARDVSVLDFYAMTDHGAGDMKNKTEFWEGLTPDEWAKNKALVKQFYVPGEFVTLLASEWSGRAPYGHHNVFYRRVKGQPFGEDRYRKVEEVWELLKVGEAFSIPHHTGITWPGGGSPATDWHLNRHDGLRPAIEVYSLWGSCEYYGNSMSYEHYFQRNFSSNPAPNYARDAWSSGHYLGVVAGSDDHNAHPGQQHGGLTAVYAKKLDRSSVFDAILHRHTYATTGQRILLQLKINDAVIGSQLRLKQGALPHIQVSIVGTDIIDKVQIMKYDGYRWAALLDANPDSRQWEIYLTDHEFDRSSLYYIRLKQRNLVGNRKVMAWSSPIWVSNTATPWWEAQE